MVIGQCTSFFAALLFEKRDTASEESALWGLLGGLQISFVVFFAVFVATIERKYTPTFFSTMTAKQFRIQAFREAASDSTKANILKLHPSYYKSIRSEIEQWVKENWDGWIEEEPEWFNDRVKASVPKDMIPTSEVEGEGRKS